MAEILDFVMGIILMVMFFQILPLIKTMSDVTNGEQVIIILMLGYGAIAGAYLFGRGLTVILERVLIDWFPQTDFGKKLIADLKTRVG